MRTWQFWNYHIGYVIRINIINPQGEKLDNMQGQIGNTRRDAETV